MNEDARELEILLLETIVYSLLTSSLENFEQVCHIVADATNAASSLKPKAGDSGKEYYQLNFDIILLFGLIELQAQIAWIENVRFTYPSLA